MENTHTFKVKGLNRTSTINLRMDEFSNLLYENESLLLDQEVWLRSIELGTITLKQQLYTIKVTANKRELIYNRYGKLVTTNPIEVNL